MKRAYKQEYCKQLIEHMKKGECFYSFAKKIGFAEETIFHWCKVHPEFSIAREKGRRLQFDYWASRAWRNAK
jgi:hypothetical protein